jgi:hAT family C-terminal dimerisation region
MFYTVIGMQLQELNNIFTEINTELLICVSCLNPKNSFSSFNKDKLLQLAQFYPSDFNQFEFLILASQLENYIMDVQNDRDFLEVNNLVELSKKLVETNRHNVYTLVYKLIKMSLLLPVATASVERVFSTMNLMKTDIRSSM